MNFRELYTLAPIGKTITYSNGAPRPPSRFTKKLREWQRHNGSGVLKECHPGYADLPESESIGLLVHAGPVLHIVQRFGPRSSLDFAVND